MGEKAGAEHKFQFYDSDKGTFLGRTGGSWGKSFITLWFLLSPHDAIQDHSTLDLYSLQNNSLNCSGHFESFLVKNQHFP